MSQNNLEDIQSDPRVLEIPIGINPRESLGDAGKDLRTSIQNVTRKYPIWKKVSEDSYRRQLHQAAVELRQLETSSSSGRSWADRKNRILVCFRDSSIENRILYRHWAIHNCSTFCDICNRTFSYSELWHLYGEYKFILSPLGHGVDCGRTWEILLMGAIPVMHYFAGIRGYLEGNLTVIPIYGPENLTETNMALWSQTFTSPTELYRLTRQYWADRVFGVGNIPFVH